MSEIIRFTDPYDPYGLWALRRAEKSRLFGRLAKLRPPATIPWRRGYFILWKLWGAAIERLLVAELERAFQRLLVLDWMTKFEILGFFTEEEIRSYAVFAGPPEDSVLGHFWYGLLGREDLSDIEKIIRRHSGHILPLAELSVIR